MIRISIFVLLAVCLFNSGVLAQDYDIYYLKYIKDDSGDYVEEKTYLYKIKSDGSKDVPVENRPLSRMDYRWSPDKNYIAYRIYEDDVETLYIRNITKGTANKICVFDGNPDLIQWSPDSSMLAVGFFSIMGDVPSKIMLFKPDGTVAKELPQQQEGWQNISWYYFWWTPDQKDFNIATDLMDEGYIIKDISSGNERAIGEVSDSADKKKSDRYEVPSGKIKDDNVSVPDEVGDVYLNGQIVAAQKDFCLSPFLGYGFHYISSLPDDKLLLLLVCARSEDILIYLYDKTTKKLTLLTKGNEVSFRNSGDTILNYEIQE
ncbi:MAG: hypothetical protein ABIC04_06960 [Nanoarchaeota archaeon]